MTRLFLAVALVLLFTRYSWLLRIIWWTITRILDFIVLLIGSGSFWWVLRSYQLQKEQELLDQALLKVNYYRKYRNNTGINTSTKSGSGSGMTDAGFQLRVLKRLPIVAYLRTCWSLPPEICTEISALVELIVKDYVSFWFQAISLNEDFRNDVKFLLADLLGAVASRVLEIDPSQALTIVAKSLELLRLHLGWFREAYAQLADEYPAVFEGDEINSNLLKRQEYVAAFVQRSPFVHPGCVETRAASSSSPRPGENAEAAYLRHVATQLLTQLKPQLGQEQDTNVFVSVAMNLLREIVGFKILKPLSEYSQSRYANEIVLSCLQAFIDEKDVGPMSPSTSSSNVVGMVPTLTLNKLRSTSSILYKASRRSGEQAEAAFQAVVEAVASAASSAAAGAAEMVLEGDDWTDSGSNLFAFGSAVFAANSGGITGEKKAMPSIFTMDDRLNVAKAAKMMDPRGLISSGLLSHKMAGDNSRITAHMDDLKNAKANIGSSLNSSIGKVKRRFRTLSNYQMDPMSTAPLGTGTGAAARMIRKPGQLLQKAWKRGESGAISPSSSLDDGAVTPTDRIRGRRIAHAMSMNSLVSPPSDDEEETTSPTVSETMKIAMVRDRVVHHLVKAVADYTKMYDECPEMHSSVRSRELYDLLSAMENVFMLGFRNPGSEDEGDHKVPSTPPLSPNVRRRFSAASSNDELTSCRDSVDTDEYPSYLDADVDDNQYYWEYLVQERPGAKFFNAHSRFVASQCPPCSPSELFVSTRGVQWVLAALVKGSLGTFCAELYAHSDVTELFYESFALLLDTTLADTVLGALSQLGNLKVCLDVPTVLGFQSDMDQELGVSPPNQWRSRDVASPSAPVSVLERVWEIERYVPTNGWVKATDKRHETLPSSEWIWEDDWALENAAKDPGESSDSEAMDSTWDYAKTFEDKYHEKRRKSDSVRRRRWVRRRCQLPPVLVLPSSPVSPSDFDVSSPLASSAIPKSAGRAGKLKQRFDALTRDKKNDKRTAASKSLPKSRSKKHDKEMSENLISDTTLGLTDTDTLQQTSTKTSAFMKARASIPSIRRGISCKNIKSPSFDYRPLSTKSSTNDDSGALYDIDDENLCSRCLNAFPSSNLGVGSCHSCHQRVCASCLDFYAFMAYPPPLKTSKKARVCGNCYDRLVSKYKLRIEAHVGKYVIKERGCGIPESSSLSASATNTATKISHHSVPPTSNGSHSGVGDTQGQTASLLSPTVGRAGTNRFEITVKVKDDSVCAWSATKTYHEFEVLEKQLTDKLKKQKKKCGKGYQACHLRSVDYTEMTSIKLSLKTVAAEGLTYEKQLHILEQFLQQLLACDTLCQSSVVQKFLLLANASGTSPVTVNPSMSRWEAGENPASPSATRGGALSNEAESNGPGVNSAGSVLVENGKWRLGRWVASDANSKETKMRVLQKIEVSLFAVLGEVFEFDGIGMVRRQIFSMTRSFIKAFLGASHFRMLERQLLSFTDPKKLSGWIGDLQVYLFSDLSDANVAPPPAPDMQVLRKDCLEAILASFPSKALSLFGDTACENAALKLHEFLQHEVFVKNLLFSIADELLLHLFPDSTPFKGKKGPGRTDTEMTREAGGASIYDGTSNVVMSATSPIPAPISSQASKELRRRSRSLAQSK